MRFDPDDDSNDDDDLEKSRLTTGGGKLYEVVRYLFLTEFCLRRLSGLLCLNSTELTSL